MENIWGLKYLSDWVETLHVHVLVTTTLVSTSRFQSRPPSRFRSRPPCPSQFRSCPHCPSQFRSCPPSPFRSGPLLLLVMNWACPFRSWPTRFETGRLALKQAGLRIRPYMYLNNFIYWLYISSTTTRQDVLTFIGLHQSFYIIVWTCYDIISSCMCKYHQGNLMNCLGMAKLRRTDGQIHSQKEWSFQGSDPTALPYHS